MNLLTKTLPLIFALILAGCLRSPEFLENEARVILDEPVDCVKISANSMVCRGKTSRRALRCLGASGCEPLAVVPCLQTNLPAERP